MPRQDSPAWGDPANFGAWERVPVVFVWNFKETEAISVGWHPTVSSDGRSLMLSRFDGQNKLVDLTTREVRIVDWPGRTSDGVIGLVGRNVIYRGLLTEGNAPAWSDAGSPLANRWQLLPIKAADISTRAFVTLTGAFDPRWAVSYGVGDCAPAQPGI